MQGDGAEHHASKLPSQDAFPSPVQVVSELLALGYELYAVVEVEVDESNKAGAHALSVVSGTRYRGRSKPPPDLLEAAATWRPYIAALVCAINPPPEIPWVAAMIDAYRSGKRFTIGRYANCRFTSATVAANLAGICGIDALEAVDTLGPMIEEVT
jgi:hypothetical protein